jgi:predicted nucleic acid-binding protein
MIVVSNTSPLTNLAAIGHFHLLQDLYGQLHIPEGVWNELNAGDIHWPGRAEVASVPWIHRHTIRNPLAVQAFSGAWGRGKRLEEIDTEIDQMRAEWDRDERRP